MAQVAQAFAQFCRLVEVIRIRHAGSGC